MTLTSFRAITYGYDRRNPEATLGVSTVNEPDRSEIPSRESVQNGNEVAESPNPWTDEGKYVHVVE